MLPGVTILCQLRVEIVHQMSGFGTDIYETPSF